MNWYPWLNPVYRQLATAWMSGQGHHALLLYGIPAPALMSWPMP